jgi:transcriptional regulator with XRE-family HTH domain
MNTVRKLREKAGFTQVQLATVGGTSQPTIAAYESGDKSLTLRTLERLASASGLDVDVLFASRMTREERRSLSLHRSIAKKLAAEPQAVLKRAKRVLGRMMARHPFAAPLLKEWQIFLERPVPDLVEVLLDIRPRARELRQVTPFAGVLSARERAEIYHAFQTDSKGERK